jgi:hypothetical protein
MRWALLLRLQRLLLPLRVLLLPPPPSLPYAFY